MQLVNVTVSVHDVYRAIVVLFEEAACHIASRLASAELGTQQ